MARLAVYRILQSRPVVVVARRPVDADVISDRG